jgi:carboxypeptidase C (cathepsin A)
MTKRTGLSYVCSLAVTLLHLQLLSVVHAQEKAAECGCSTHAEQLAAIQAPVKQRGSVLIGTTKLDYTVTAGMLRIADSQGQPRADMFYVAYVADTKRSGSERPVTFAFNGGPGSSDALLHFLALGPRRADISLPRAPDQDDNSVLSLKENAESILDRTDLVFIDAVSTGYSHAIGKAQDSEFWGLDEDAESFSAGIQNWLNLNLRWGSPVAILGESYGGSRASILGALLPGKGVRLRAVILVSPGLNDSSMDWYSDSYFAEFLPSYAASAWYYKRAGKEVSTLEAFVADARKFALGEYTVALGQGSNLSQDDRNAVAQRMAEFTGLEQAYLLRNNLRVNPLQFGKELLRSRQIVVGPLDARQGGIDVDPNGPPADVDPISIYLASHLAPLVKDYLNRELGYHTEQLYRFNNPAVQDPWDWKRKVRDEYPWTSRPPGYDLANSVDQHPEIKVLILSGYYDLVVPFLRTEDAVSHMPIYAGLRKNFSLEYYEAGHMVYVDTASRKKLKVDLNRFYDATFAGERRAAAH